MSKRQDSADRGTRCHLDGSGAIPDRFSAGGEMNSSEVEKPDRQEPEVEGRTQGPLASSPSAQHLSQVSQPPIVPGKEFWPRLAAVGGLLGAAFLWSYWPTLCGLVNMWNHVQDYSHGYLVAPLAVFFLWARRDRMPAPATGLAWPGLVLVAISVAMRFAGAWYYLEFLDGWSILPWVAGVIWLFLGRAFVWWSLPSVAFLLFMVRIPFSAELALSLPLQTVATRTELLGAANARPAGPGRRAHDLFRRTHAGGRAGLLGAADLHRHWRFGLRLCSDRAADVVGEGVVARERGSDRLDRQCHAGGGYGPVVPIRLGRGCAANSATTRPAWP